jgi:hypothetical protein
VRMEAEHQGKSWLEIKSLEQEQDPMASFHKGPMHFRGVKGHSLVAVSRSWTPRVHSAIWNGYSAARGQLVAGCDRVQMQQGTDCLIDSYLC